MAPTRRVFPAYILWVLWKAGYANFPTKAWPHDFSMAHAMFLLDVQAEKERAAVEAHNTLDARLWRAAFEHIDVLVEQEKQLDGDGGAKFEAELQE